MILFFLININSLFILFLWITDRTVVTFCSSIYFMDVVNKASKQIACSMFKRDVNDCYNAKSDRATRVTL